MPALLSAVGVLAAIFGIGTAAGQDGVAACSVSAWSDDKDPNGLNVRAEPHAYSPVIAALPPPVVDSGYEFGTEVSITGSKDGWFRIDRGVVENYTTDDPTKVVFEGVGWVSGRFLATSVEGQYLRAAPSHEATPVVDFHEAFKTNEPDAGSEYFVLERLHACSGGWLEVEGIYHGERVRGWTDDTCSNQVTTCP